MAIAATVPDRDKRAEASAPAAGESGVIRLAPLGLVVFAASMAGPFTESVFGVWAVMILTLIGLMSFSIGVRLSQLAIAPALASASVLGAGAFPWVLTPSVLSSNDLRRLLLSLTIGACAGIVTAIAFAGIDDDAQSWTVLLGCLALAGGAATMAGLSPPLVACLSGMTATRVAREPARERIAACISWRG